MGTTFLSSMINGLGRKTGFTASARLTEGLGKKIINPKSKFRKKIDRFELTGDFVTSIKKLRTLIEIFYEEYTINDLPMVQVSMYLESDINLIENKIEFITNYIVDDDQRNDYESLLILWKNVKDKTLPK
jgi:hypothetical protein